eukprot:7393101-Pyramimonas_sp.AAC.1
MENERLVNWPSFIAKMAFAPKAEGGLRRRPEQDWASAGALLDLEVFRAGPAPVPRERGRQ